MTQSRRNEFADEADVSALRSAAMGSLRYWLLVFEGDHEVTLACARQTMREYMERRAQLGEPCEGEAETRRLMQEKPSLGPCMSFRCEAPAVAILDGVPVCAEHGTSGVVQQGPSPRCDIAVPCTLPEGHEGPCRSEPPQVEVSTPAAGWRCLLCGWMSHQERDACLRCGHPRRSDSDLGGSTR